VFLNLHAMLLGISDSSARRSLANRFGQKPMLFSEPLEMNLIELSLKNG
jgi:hypothetical protein